MIVILSILLLRGCSQHTQQHKELEEAIYSVVKDSQNSEIDIAMLTDFTWEKAFLITPYTPQESIEEQIKGFKDPSNIDYRDDIYLLVFLNEGEAIYYVEIDRLQSDFSMKEQDYLTPTKSVIKIDR